MEDIRRFRFTGIPWGVIIWLIVTVLLIPVSTLVVSLVDEEVFVNDIVVEAEAGEGENTLVLRVTAGTFEYGVQPFEAINLQTGTFTPEQSSAFTSLLFENVSELTTIQVGPQEIRISYEGDMEADAMLRRVRRLVVNNLLNENVTGTVDPDDNQTIVFATSEQRFQTGRFVPALIAEGTIEEYASRQEGLNGSPLARRLFEEVPRIEALIIQPDQLIVTYAEGSSPNQFENRIQTTLDAFYPRASLAPTLWIFGLSFSPDKLISITPINTGIALYWFTLVVAVIEGAMYVLLANRDDRLFRPLVRVATIFLFSWSIFGDEPFWDFLLSQIFPTSRQLIYPTATVIEFAAQHLELVIVSSLITIPMGLLTGIVVTRDSFREVLPLVNNLVNSGQTVPTIAIVAFMAPIIGFGFWPAIIALIAYGLLPVVRNTIAGLEAVDAFVIDSARGMGMTPTQILLRIELPIASGIIMAGIRTSMVVNVGTATLGAFVGSGGLGTPIASGLSMTIDAFILLGAIPAAILAILVDYILSRVEFVITPKGLQIET